MAAIAVCLFHFFPTYEVIRGYFSIFPLLASKGFFGVDLFFVVSGFVMALATAGSPATPATVLRLIARRGLRLYVPYWMIIPLAVLVALCSGSGFFGKHNVMDNLFLTTLSHQTLLIPATWFLPFLMYFGTVYAISLLLSEKRQLGAYWLVFGVLCLKAVLAPNLSDLLLHPFAVEFLAGVLLFRVNTGFLDRSYASIGLVVLAIVSFALGVFVSAESNGFRVLTYGCCAWCVVSLLVKGESACRVPLPGFIRILADSSYALFLLHGPLLAFFYSLGLVDLLRELNQFWRECVCAGVLGLVIMAACMFHVMLERPVSRNIASWLNARTAKWGA